MAGDEFDEERKARSKLSLDALIREMGIGDKEEREFSFTLIGGFRSVVCLVEPDPALQAADKVTKEMVKEAAALGAKEGEAFRSELGGPLFLDESHYRAIIATYPEVEKELGRGLSRSERDAYMAAAKKVVELGAKTPEQKDIELCREKGTMQGRAVLLFHENTRMTMSGEEISKEFQKLDAIEKEAGHKLSQHARDAYFLALRAECEPLPVTRDQIVNGETPKKEKKARGSKGEQRPEA